MRAPKASIYHIAQSGKNKGMPAVCRAAPRQVPTHHQRRAASAPLPNARRGRRARSRRLPSVHENHATMGARRKRAETPHPRRGDSRRVGDHATRTNPPRVARPADQRRCARIQPDGGRHSRLRARRLLRTPLRTHRESSTRRAERSPRIGGRIR